MACEDIGDLKTRAAAGTVIRGTVVGVRFASNVPADETVKRDAKGALA